MDPQQAQDMAVHMLPFIFLFALIFMVIVLIPLWFICKKAGFTPWLSLLIFIPLGNLVLLYVLAFAEWKVVPISQVQAPYFPPAPPPIPPLG